MPRLVLLNDVECELDSAGIIVGSSLSPCSQRGKHQSDQISECLSKKFPKFDAIAASDAVRLTHLLHQIRKKCIVTTPRIRYSDALRERNFGVLTGTIFMSGFQSDLFTHSRICAEKGESVAECAARAMQFVKGFFSQASKNILCVSHPFLCQIICNAICNKKQTALTKFWFQEGAFMVANFSDVWKVKLFYHSISEMEYSEEQVYSDVMK